MPDVEVAGNGCASGIADGKLWNLDQTGLDGVDQAEVAHDPGKRAIGGLSDAAEEIGGGGKIDAKINAAQLLNLIQTFDPDGCFFEELVCLLLFAEDFFL